MARTVLETPGEDVGVFGGQYDIYGTTSGGEEITVLTGTDVWLDPSFNTGGDTLRLPGEAEEYTARVEGSYVILTSVINDVMVEIPIGPAGITIIFGGDDTRTLNFDTVQGRVEIDGVPIDGSADPLPAGNDTPPITYTVMANSPTVTEGDTGARSLTYTITLSQPADEAVVITYTTLAGGTAEINDDFQPVTGTVTIPAGSTTAFISVPVFGDTAVEGNETVQLQLTSPDMVAPQVLTGTIIDDDANQTQFNLNPGSETIFGTESNDTFRASNYELGAGDVIFGLGGTDTLQVFIDENAPGFDSIDYSAFELNSVEQVLVTNDSGDGVTLDMSGADGVDAVGSVNSSDDVDFEFLTSLADVIIRDITTGPGFTDIRVSYQTPVTAGAADAVTVTLEDSAVDEIEIGTIDNAGNITQDGIETINLIVSGDSSAEQLDTDLTTLNISGAGDLEIDQALNDTVRTINATGLAGDLDLDFSNNTAGVTYDGSTGDNMVDAGAGDDDIETQGGDDTVSGNDGDDMIDTNAGDDTVYGGNGDDTIDLGTGDNYAEGGADDDFITATTDGVTLAGGYNEVYGESGNDTVVLGNGGSYVDLGSGDDELDTGSGNDTVIAGSGSDDIFTDGGSDTAVFGSELGIEDTVDLGTGNDFLQTDAGTVDADYTNVSNTENLVLTSSGITVLGAQAQQAGITTIFGTNGNDDVNAGAFTSNLTFNPGFGDDVLTSGSGDDTFNFVGDGALSDGDVVAAGTGLDTINSTGSIHLDMTNLTGIDVINLYSNGLNDSMWINNLNPANADENGVLVINAGTLGSDDFLYLDPTIHGGVSPAFQLDVTGGAGDDYIETGLADDTVRAGAGDDQVFGLAGGDDLHLGAGDDYADGDVGADRFYGDTGADVMDLGIDGDTDTVLYANVSDSTFAGGDGRDTINEFDSGEDQIDIGELLARNGIDPGNTEYIYGQDLDQAEAQMVAGDGIISYVFVEEIPGDVADADTTNTSGYFFVDINDDGELGGEDLQLFVNGDDVMAGDVDITPDNLAGQSGYDVFIEDVGMGMMAKLADASFA